MASIHACVEEQLAYFGRLHGVGYAALASDNDGLLANLLTIFPPTAPLVLPARSALTGVPLWEHVLAVAFMLAAIYALVRVAGRIYLYGILRGGPRIGLRAAWRLTNDGRA